MAGCRIRSGQFCIPRRSDRASAHHQDIIGHKDRRFEFARSSSWIRQKSVRAWSGGLCNARPCRLSVDVSRLTDGVGVIRSMSYSALDPVRGITCGVQHSREKPQAEIQTKSGRDVSSSKANVASFMPSVSCCPRRSSEFGGVQTGEQTTGTPQAARLKARQRGWCLFLVAFNQYRRPATCSRTCFDRRGQEPDVHPG